MTKFLEDHPGGDEVLLSATGIYIYIYFLHLVDMGDFDGLKRWFSEFNDVLK